MSKLSKQAASALLAAQGRVGASVRGTNETMNELSAKRLVTPTDNLTTKGQRERAALARRLEDEAFGG